MKIAGVTALNMENSAETAPLLNDYKKEYFFQRFSQTVFGGPLFKQSSDDGSYGLPIYVHFYQFIVFILPLILASVFTVITETNNDINYWISIAFGCIMALILLLLHIYRDSVSKNNPSLGSVTDLDEDENKLQGCCGIKQVLMFVIKKKRWKLQLVIHAIIYGVVNGMIFLYLLPSTTSKLNAFQSKYTAIIFFIISWITSCTGLYGLIARPPKEPCQFRSTDPFEVLVTTRPLYMSIFCTVGILAMFYNSLSTVDLVLRILYPLLPVFWTFGMLPPTDCLLSWLGEQVLVFAFGGSPMANNLRLFLMLTLSCICWLIVYAISDTTVALTVAACFGFILSTDISTGFEKIASFILRRSKVENMNRSRPGNAASYSIWKISFFVLIFISTALIASLISSFVLDEKKPSLLDITGYAIISCFVIQRICGSMLSFYVFFGVIKNLMYSVLRKSKGKRAVVLLRKILADCVVPLLLVAFMTCSAGNADSETTLSALSYSLFASRVYRIAWQNQHDCAFDVAIVMVMKYSSMTTANWWDSLHLHVQLFLINILRNRAQNLWNLLSFAVRYAYKFYFSRKVRHKSHKKVAMISLLSLPLLVICFCLSALLCAPLLPIFTLPIFLMGFVRPRIFWPHADVKLHSSSKDWVYYRQLTPSLLDQLKDTIASGSLGEMTAGEHFLARFQDRIFWLVVAERGFMHTNVIVKGLELAETSCHTVEAGRIDEMFEYMIGDGPRSVVNPYPGHCLLPRDMIELDAYSDAKNVLTGVIDQPDNLKKLSENFVKTLTWVLLRFSKSRRDRGLGDGPTVEELKKRHEMRQKRQSLSTPRTNETKDTFVIRSDTVDDILRKRSSSSYSRSSLSDNSMKELWSNREAFKLKPVNGKYDDTKQGSHTVKGMPTIDIPSSEKVKEAAIKQPAFRGPNLVMNDDFDDFGFDDFDGGFAREDSFENVINDENKSRPAVSSFVDTKSSNDLFSQTKAVKRNTLPSLEIDVSSPHSSLVEPPLRWKQSIPVDAVDITKRQDVFSEQWFAFVITQLDLEGNGEHVFKSISADRGLFMIFRKLVVACHVALYEQQQHTALDVWKMFGGNFPWSRYSSWFENDTELQQNVLLAYRYAFKLMYDEAVLGPIDDFQELAENLLDYEQNWHMGNDDVDAWVNAVLAGTPNLLSVGYQKEDGIFTSRVLTKQKIMVPIGRLDPENVKAIWSSLSLELLYFTNDDEERYSIQAHPSHLRNIIVQAADPPLGYPVYSSGLLNVVAW